jgi:hypothetical protein
MGRLRELKALGFSRTDAATKRILDIGIGSKGSFLDMGKGIIGVDPVFNWHNNSMKMKILRRWRPSPEARRRGVIARAEMLPFRKGSFDHVISMHAMGQYLGSISFAPALAESLYALKTGGDVRLLVTKGHRGLHSTIRRLEPDLRQNGIGVEWRDAPGLEFGFKVLVLRKTREIEPARLKELALAGRRG